MQKVNQATCFKFAEMLLALAKYEGLESDQFKIHSTKLNPIQGICFNFCYHLYCMINLYRTYIELI